jgi:exodeoxyribonuclease I
MTQPSKQFLFYDFETTGLNVVFDQPVQFASVRFGAAGEEIEANSFRIRLRPDIVPTLGALRTTGLTPEDLQTGMSEYEAACRIHYEFNRQDTISIGYNSFLFDDQMSRFLFYRNLLDPYSHQWANGCGRADVLPMLPLFKIFAPKALKFPTREDGTPTFKLGAMAVENGIDAAQAHDAGADVQMTIELFKRMRDANPKLMEAALKRFVKREDVSALDELTPVRAGSSEVKFAVLISHRAHDDKYQQPAVLARTESTGRQLWLLLERDLTGYLRGENLNRPIFVSRRPGEPPFVLKAEKAQFPEERKGIVRQNLKLIGEKGIRPFLEGLNGEFPAHDHLDLDSSLYSGDFFSDMNAAQDDVRSFHNALAGEIRWSIAQRMPNERFRDLALRVIYRNDFDCPQAKRAGEDFVRARLEGKPVTVDFRGRERGSLDTLKAEIMAEFQKDVSEPERALLESVAEAYHLNIGELAKPAESIPEEATQDTVPSESEPIEQQEASAIETTPEKEVSKGSASDKKKRKRVVVDDTPFGKCECGLPLVERFILVVDSTCWKCTSEMKIAMSATDQDGNYTGSPEDFSPEELDFAQAQGVIIQTVFSKTQNRPYPANVCGQCRTMTGEFYMTKHTPGYLEMMEGTRPLTIGKKFGLICERCSCLENNFDQSTER